MDKKKQIIIIIKLPLVQPPNTPWNEMKLLK